MKERWSQVDEKSSLPIYSVAEYPILPKSSKGFTTHRMDIMKLSHPCNMVYITLADLGGVPGARPPPPMGPNSFIFAYIFTEKCPRRRSTPPLTGARPPMRNPGSATASYCHILSQAELHTNMFFNKTIMTANSGILTFHNVMPICKFRACSNEDLFPTDTE